MVNGIGEILSDKQLPRDSWEKRRGTKIPIGEVDSLADELVKEYANPVYRKWYCKIINDYGIAQVLEWRNRAKDGDFPGKLFSKYANDAKAYRSPGDGLDA